ncbi:DUF5994 family protein [Thermomonospora cellulosilytica]|uniref:Uncharacterized protein n=1 Tax=Thermomonospora cellulosilytica TaxID=1411118 RepID=A0A7W3MTD7_9ACTN|nr:DUF5994 family protein [Thermomonospora cellulosilytica]MBA9001538.1 hypothetical protein [Thermomonospora cellulosilytica]
MWTTAERATTISLSPPSEPRLSLRPPRPVGAVPTMLDGGWWPRSADPVAELPGLILALQAHDPAGARSPVTRVLLAVADWSDRPRRLRIDGPAESQVVRLGWFDTLPAGLLTAIRADGHRTDLLTVPASAGRAAAWAAMEAAADPGNRIDTPGLLATLGTPPGPARQAETEAPQNARESEGGRL